MILAVPIGLLVVNLYKAGAFDYILDDVRILADGVLSLRDRSRPGLPKRRSLKMVMRIVFEKM